MKMKLYGALLIVFVSGLCAGYVLGQHVDRLRMRHLVQRGPERMEMFISERLNRHLGLDDVQKREVQVKVAAVIQQAHEDMNRQGEMIRARMTGLLTDIRPLLNPAQQRILDRMDIDDLRPGPPRGEPPRLPSFGEHSREGRGGPPPHPGEVPNRMPPPDL